MTRIRSLINRLIVYLLGMLILAFGIALSIQAGLGLSPISATPYVLSVATDLSMGTWTIIIYSLFILVQILLLRKDFKWINLTQILFSTIFGYFVNFTTTLLSGLIFPGYIGSLLMLALSIVVIALGISLYVGAGIMNMPAEGTTVAIASKLKTKYFGQVIVMQDSTLVVIAVILSFILEGRLVSVREGTVISALLIGTTVKAMSKFLQPILDRLLKNPEAPPDIAPEAPQNQDPDSPSEAIAGSDEVVK